MTIGSKPRWSVVLLAPEGAAADSLAAALRERGLAVRCAGGIGAALDSVRRAAPDAIVVAAPVLEPVDSLDPAAGGAREVDLVSVCAALTEGAAPPAVILLDPADLAAPLRHVLPEPRRPAAVLPRAVEPDKLVAELEAILDWGGSAPARPASTGPRFARLLTELAEQRQTGVLEIRAGGICTRIHLRDGAPVFAEGGSLRETLGRALLRRGEIGEDDYLRVVERMTERLIENETIRMGEVLVELGLMTPQEVFEALAEQVREKIVACFQWSHVTHAFEALDELPEDVRAYRCPPVEVLVLQGLREHWGSERLEPVLAPHLDRHPWLREDVEATAARLGLSPSEARWVRGLDGRRRTRAILTDGALDPPRAQQLLAALWLAGRVGFAESPRQRSEPADEAGPLPRSGGAESRPRPGPRRTPRVTALEGLRRTLARERDRSPAKTEPAAALDAERHFRQGVRLLAQGLLPGALRAFRGACERAPDQAEYHMYRSWVEHQSAREEERRALTRSQAAAAAQRMLEQDGRCLRAHTILGELARETGDRSAAERWLRLALRIDPQDREAQRGMRLLGARPS